jgi:hypothetical protein
MLDIAILAAPAYPILRLDMKKVKKIAIIVLSDAGAL